MTSQLLQSVPRDDDEEEPAIPETLDVHVRFDGLEHSAELYASIVDHAEELKQLAPETLACDATVKRVDPRHERDERVMVQLQVRLPAAQLYTGQSTRACNAQSDPIRAVAESFSAMRQRLRNYERQRRGKARKKAVAASPTEHFEPPSSHSID